MSNSLPPDQRPPRLRDDEPIALLVTFLAFGAIFWWALSQGRGTWDLASFVPGLSGSPAPTTSPSAFPTLAPTSPATVDRGTGTSNPAGVTSSPAPTPQPTVGLGTSEPQVVPTAAPTVIPTVAPTAAPTNPSGVTPASPSPVPPAPPSSASPAPGKAIAFPDVPANYWAAPFIGALSARGIIGGFPDGTFKPNQPVTRAQFAVQLQKAFTKPDRQPPKQFTDIPPGSRWATAVDKAVKANFMSGYPEGDFRPEQDVSRAEAVTSMAQGLKLQQPADPEAILQGYRDRDQVPSWARGRIAAAIQAGIFSGDPDTQLLNPARPATRADIAALVYKGLEASGTAAK
ncbi:MAG: S-layer homology domain-containing protein [Leptolyngbyaceae cyanobacterium bins.302]|nr:S-layer homology domain-containing protein [Leptolyngbyaceae cyanobacterium bins.302]